MKRQRKIPKNPKIEFDPQLLEALDQADMEAVGKELEARRYARQSLLSFVQYVRPDYQVAKHHKFIAERLQQVATKPHQRIILNLPPRSGKSTLASIHLPAWFMGKFPAKDVILAAYNADFATEFGREVRNLVASEPCQRVFPNLSLAQDSQSKDRWHTAVGGSFLAAGIGSGITGKGGHLILIDDPVKSRNEAESKSYRDRIWDWYRADLYSRLMPGASVCVVQTRWSDDDLAGHLLREKTGGIPWEVINFPAIAEESDVLGRERGDALWPEWYPIEVLNEIKATVGDREWSCLYQQKPVQEEGEYFKIQWFREYDQDQFLEDHPAVLSASGRRTFSELHIYGASDFAVSDEKGDYTVHAVIGMDPEQNIYLLDLWRQRAEPDKSIDEFLRLVDRWGPLSWGMESGQIRRAIGPFLRKRMQEKGVFVVIQEYPTVRNKSIRAQAIRGRIGQGRFFLPRKAEWKAEFLYECSRFPTIDHDDQVDCLAIFGHMLDGMSPGRQKPEEEAPTTQTFRPTTFGELMKAHKRGKLLGRRIKQAIVIQP